MANSQSIVIISHLAGGSVMSLIRRVDHRWKRVDVEPPVVGEARYGVTDVVEKDGKVTVTYRVFWRGGLAEAPGYGTVEFTVNAVEGTLSDLVKKEISLKRFESMRLLDDL